AAGTDRRVRRERAVDDRHIARVNENATALSRSAADDPQSGKYDVAAHDVKYAISQPARDDLGLAGAQALDRDVALNLERAALAGGAGAGGAGQRVGARPENNGARARCLIGLEDRRAQRPCADAVGELAHHESGWRNPFLEYQQGRP